jgi:hypothetical protein
MTKLTLLVASMFGCGDLQNFDGEVPPLATLHANVTGDFESVRVPDSPPPNLRVTVVWGAQWLSEPTCTTPPTTPELTDLLTAGCRHPLFFTPNRATTSVAFEPDVPFDLPITDLPGGDVMIGGLAARIAYASLVVFDDRDANGALELRYTQRPPYGDIFGPPEDEFDEDLPITDVIYGASFAAMTEPDMRLAFREGGFNRISAFYPREGCGEPPPRFGVLSAGGFSITEAIIATSQARLPSQDPATCAEATPDATTIQIPLRTPADVQEVGCLQRELDGAIHYHKPTTTPIDFTDRSYHCRVVPDTELAELIVTQRTTDPCRGITHYVLRGCDDDERLDCTVANWDFTRSPPEWWPCP